VTGDRTPEWRDESQLLAQLERQARALEEQGRELGELRARLHEQEEELRDARTVSTLLLRSRGYRVMRALGRWGWLERRIRRALR
jgi:hypothetical protein